MTIGGKGICIAVPKWTVNHNIKEGSLVEFLPEWQLPKLPIYLVWRYRSRYSFLFREFINYIECRWNAFF